MENEQAREWAEAQKIAFSVDLVEAAKKHLKFLAEVERNRFLYEDHVIERAIYRYNAFWLPLIAKHLENPISQEPLVVPLDCEWIWHCHRLNPLRYKLDCERLFGGILGNEKVLSSVQATSKNTTEEIWTQMYPDEPYALDLSRPFQKDGLQKSAQNVKFTSYDLLSAVKKKMSFPFQMSRPYTSDDLFLQEAVGRYKGFLHLIRTNDKKNIKCFCVPTYDVDLMWHTHQLYPNSYCNDLIETVGKGLHHNDKVSDRTPGKLLQTGFSETVKLWDEIFGRRYRKAGTQYLGSPPTPVTQVPLKFNNVDVMELGSFENCGKSIQFLSTRAVEVLLEFGEVMNLAEEHKRNLIVLFSKKQPDQLFNTKRSLDISSKLGEKQIASFECEPTGEFLFELMSYSPSSDELKLNRSLNLLGSCSISLQEMISSGTHLSVDKWLPVQLVPGLISCKPVALHVSVSFTPPMLAPQVFQLVKCQPFCKAKHANIPTKVMDRDGKDVFSLHMRNLIEDTTKNSPDVLEVYCITNSGEKHVLAEFAGNSWSVSGPYGLLQFQNNSKTDDILLELVGNKMVKLFCGRRLKFESVHLENQNLEQGFVTAVEFSAEYPYGKAIALIDLKSGTIKAIDEWFVLPGIALTFILSAILRGVIDSDKGNGMEGVFSKSDGFERDFGLISDAANCSACGMPCGQLGNMVKDGDAANCSACGMACGQLGNMVKDGDATNYSACFIACGQLENMVKDGDAANYSACFIACGQLENMVKDGDAANCSACGMACGQLGNMVKMDEAAQCYRCYSCFWCLAMDGEVDGDQ